MAEVDPGRVSPLVWVLRLATAGMMVAAVMLGWRKFRTTPEQEELTRYATLTVPAYLGDVAEVQERLDRLTSPAPSQGKDGGTLTPPQARALLADEVMPMLIRLRKRASSVATVSDAVRRSNAEYLSAIDLLLEAGRTGVRAVDDPALSGEEGFHQLRSRRHEADAALRGWMENLRARCQQAGLKTAATSGKQPR